MELVNPSVKPEVIDLTHDEDIKLSDYNQVERSQHSCVGQSSGAAEISEIFPRANNSRYDETVTPLFNFEDFKIDPAEPLPLFAAKNVSDVRSSSPHLDDPSPDRVIKVTSNLSCGISHPIIGDTSEFLSNRKYNNKENIDCSSSASDAGPECRNNAGSVDVGEVFLEANE